MFFNLPEFLDSLVGLRRGEAAKLIAVEIESIEEYNRISIFDVSQDREFSRELNFLKALAEEIITPGYYGVLEIDRPVVNEFLTTLKPVLAIDANKPVKAVKSTKPIKATKPAKAAKASKPAKAAKKAAPAKKATAAKKSKPKK